MHKDWLIVLGSLALTICAVLYMGAARADEWNDPVNCEVYAGGSAYAAQEYRDKGVEFSEAVGAEFDATIGVFPEGKLPPLLAQEIYLAIKFAYDNPKLSGWDLFHSYLFVCSNRLPRRVAI